MSASRVGLSHALCPAQVNLAKFVAILSTTTDTVDRRFPVVLETCGAQNHGRVITAIVIGDGRDQSRDLDDVVAAVERHQGHVAKGPKEEAKEALRELGTQPPAGKA